MSPLLRAVAAATVALLTSSAVFASASYSDVRSARPDGRVIAINQLTFNRDAYQFTLTGQLHLLTRADGKTFGAVFTGQGSYQLEPASDVERRHLAIVTGDDKLVTLADTFESAVFFARDLIAAAEKAGAAKEAAPGSAALSTFDEYLKRQRKDFSTNIHIRVLQDLLNEPSSEPFFFAWLDGKKHPPALLVADPLGADAMRVTPAMLGGEETMMLVYDQTKGGAWYLSHPKKEIDEGSAVVELPLVDAEHYLVDTTIAPNAEINATTEVTFKANAANIRVLPINLMGRLRIDSASYKPVAAAEWERAEVIQEKWDEDSDAALVLPAPLEAGGRYALKIAYQGKDVLFNAGDGNFSVGSRQSWYPNFGTFVDLATFELKFRNPQKLQIVAVGEETENRVEGNLRVATWKSAQPLRVAGFNYGNFRKLSQNDKDSGMVVEVYTNPGTPDIIREINMYLEAASQDPTGDYVGPGFVKADTARLAQSAMADGINTARVGNLYFGKLPQKRVAITQQSQWSFGQSWPSLIYMPFLAFLDGTTRMTLGLTGAKDFVDSVGAHEFGHQWWGHHVGWRSYHDQWLSEGFAEFTASLVVQNTGGWDRYNKFWEKKRRYILDKPRGASITTTSRSSCGTLWPATASWSTRSPPPSPRGRDASHRRRGR